MELGERLGALSEQPFRLLWLGQTLSRIGDSLMPVAVAFAVIELTGSATDLGLVMATLMGSRVALLLVGGVWADRLSRRAVMVAADLARALGQGALAFLLITGRAELWHMIVAAAVAGVSTAFFNPASTGLIPQTVATERLQQANALMGLSRSTVNIFGPGVAGLLVAGFGPGWAFAIDAASYAASIGFLVALRLPALAAPLTRKPFLSDLKEGWDAVTGRVWLWTNFVVAAVANVAMAAFVVLGPVVVDRELGGAAQWGLVVMGGGMGGVVGGAIALRLRPERPLVATYVAVLPVGVPLLLLIAPAATVALAAGYGLVVAGITLGNAIWSAVLQERVPQETLSRVTSYDWMVSLLFMPLGYSIAGPLADAVGAATAMIGIAAVASAAPALVLLVPEVRDLRRSGPRAKPVLAGQ